MQVQESLPLLRSPKDILLFCDTTRASDGAAPLLRWVCALVIVANQCGEKSVRLESHAAQVLALIVFGWVRPDILRQRAPCLLKVGPSTNLFAFHFKGKWCVVAVDEPRTHQQPIEFGFSHLRQAENPFYECNPFYRGRSQMWITEGDAGETLVEEGCGIGVYLHNCAMNLDLWFRSEGGLSDTEKVRRIFSSQYIFNEQMTQERAKWILERANSDFPLVIELRRCLGLTHPEIPFAESRSTVVVDDPAVIEQILEDVSPRLGLRLHLEVAFNPMSFAYMPYSFPPALCDSDRRWQEAHLAAARQQLGADEELAAATEALVKERIGKDLQALEDEDWKDILDQANALVREALASLHAAQKLANAPQEAAQSIIEVVLDQMFAELSDRQKLRHEWAKRVHWVEKQSVERRGPKKGKHRTGKNPQAEAAPMRSRHEAKHAVKNAVADLGLRSKLHARTAATLVCLEAAGFARFLDLAPSEALPTQVLPPLPFPADGAEVPEECTPSVFRSECVEVIFSAHPHPDVSRHVRHRSSCEAPSRCQQSFATKLDESVARDQQFAQAHADEIALKLALEMSIAEFTIDTPIENSCPPTSAPQFSRAASSSDRHAPTLRSWASAPAAQDVQHCFLPGTTFARAGDASFVRVDELLAAGGDCLVGPGGLIARVTRSVRVPASERDLVRLRTEGAPAAFIVTVDHRLLTCGSDQSPEPIEAQSIIRDVAQGRAREIFDGRDWHRVVEATPFTKVCEVIKVSFDADAPVLAFLLSRRHRRSASADVPTIAVLGDAPGQKDWLQSRGFGCFRTFVDQNRSTVAVHSRSRSTGAMPSPVSAWSVGTVPHDDAHPGSCVVCIKHHRFLSDIDGGSPEKAKPCGLFGSCRKCHAPHHEYGRSWDGMHR